jgi:hypothetical protein
LLVDLRIELLDQNRGLRGKLRGRHTRLQQRVGLLRKLRAGQDQCALKNRLQALGLRIDVRQTSRNTRAAFGLGERDQSFDLSGPKVSAQIAIRRSCSAGHQRRRSEGR